MTLARPTNAPAAYSQDGLGYEAIVHARYYVPDHIAVWFVTEYDSKYDEIFGWAEIIPGCGELGYTSLAELEASGLAVFDTKWQPTTLREAMQKRAEALDAEDAKVLS